MATLTLKPTGGAGIDTSLVDALGTYNWGATNIIYAGKDGAKDRGLLQFDLSSVPAGAVVSSAILTLGCESTQSAISYNIGVHRSLVQWYEGVKNGAAPDGGQDGSTWNLRNANGSVAWAGGVGGASGSDWASTATATTAVTGTGFYDWDVTADVVAWLSGTANYGWWIINASETTSASRKDFASSDHVNTSDVPRLVITYSTALPSGLIHKRVSQSTLLRM